MDKVEARIAAIAARIACDDWVGPESRLYHDLAIAGDDASELLEELLSAFPIDMTGFEFSRFFPEEADALWEHWAGKIGLGTKRPPLTIRHLAKVARDGVWKDPAPAARS